MKRVFALLLALAMVMSLGITAFATGTPTNGSITITNATIGDTYSVYKIFDATYDVTSGDLNNDGVKDQVSYSISNDNNPIYDYMFTGSGAVEDAAAGTITNDYFVYYKDTGLVIRRTDNNNKDQDMFDYLAAMVRALEANLVTQGKHLYLQAKTADNKTVEFSSLDFGYYLIDKSANADGTDVAVTITSNTPAIEVIDKNQKPASGFSKLVWDEKKEEWVTGNSANIGDIIEFKVEFDTTNYDGEGLILYYNILDTKTSSLWIEFDDIAVSVSYMENGTEVNIPLTKGYYHGTAGEHSANNEWEYLGTGWDKDASGNAYCDPQTAQWYLIHYGYDEIEIVIPWLENHTFTGGTTKADAYEITYPTDNQTGEITSDSLYPSPATVVVTYSAAVGPDAAGITSRNNATLDWNTDKVDPVPGEPSTTTTTVYNMGITKIAAGDLNSRLAGAVFELYGSYDETTKTYSDPVYVIPTNNTGVYIVDDVDTDISGVNKKYSRELYEAKYWETWVEQGTKTVMVDGTPVKVRNDVETPVSGQVVILGLEAGTYYLKETKAPDGYNLLPDVATVTVGTGDTAPYSNGYKTLQGEDIEYYTVYSKIVENNKGVQLPSTGGMGTMMLITFGSVIAMAFAVLMITQKKMSVYRD